MSERIGGVHQAASAGFGSAAGEYERSRPDYPADALALMGSMLGIRSGSRVLDLACGTGKMTRLLHPTGATVVGLDPVGAMLHRFRAVLPDAPVAAGTAENMPFSGGSFDSVVVAQAFHWFDGPAALAEIHRILRPGAMLGLIWNVRDESVPWVAKMGEIFRDYENRSAADVLRFWRGAWRKAFQKTSLFTALERADFRHDQTLTRDGVVERVLSVSFIATLPPAERDGVAARIRRIVEEDPQTRDLAEISLPYNVQLYWCRRNS